MLTVCSKPELSIGKHNHECDNFVEHDSLGKVIEWP